MGPSSARAYPMRPAVASPGPPLRPCAPTQLYSSSRFDLSLYRL
jgi:hypothetical protein